MIDAATRSPSCCPSCGYNLAAQRVRRFGALEVGPAGVVKWDGRVVRLSAAQVEVVAGIAHAAPRPLSTTALMLRLGSAGDSNVVAVHISRIRARLKSAGAPPLIISVSGRGYRLAVESLTPRTDAPEC